MEKLVNEKHYEESLVYQILGNEKQTLQVVLMPGQSIVTKKESILYASDNITQSQLSLSLFQRVLAYVQMRNTELGIELRNESGGVGYVGLQAMKGRVIIIDNPKLYVIQLKTNSIVLQILNEATPQMIVKEKYVLARTMNVDLIPTWSPGDAGRTAGLKQIKAIKPKNLINPLHKDLNISDMLRQELDKPLSDQYRDLSRRSAELVFMQSQSNFIEKTLGANEKMKIRPECIVAFSPTVNVQRDFNGGLVQMFSSRGKFATLVGPGLVYIDMQVGSRFFKKDQLSLYVVVLYFLLYFLMFLIMTFDRRLERLMAGAAVAAAEGA